MTAKPYCAIASASSPRPQPTTSAFLPSPLRQLVGPLNLFATTGFLPEEFRAHMQLPWTRAQQRWFELLLTGLRVADRVIPRDLWVFSYGLYLRSMRTRARLGRRVI